MVADWSRSSCFSAVHDGQRPAPTGQLPGHPDGGHRGPFLAGVERPPPLVEPAVRLIRPGPHVGWLPVAATDHLRRQPVRFAVMPGRFHQQPAGVAVAGLGDRTLGT